MYTCISYSASFCFFTFLRDFLTADNLHMFRIFAITCIQKGDGRMDQQALVRSSAILQKLVIQSAQRSRLSARNENDNEIDESE